LWASLGLMLEFPGYQELMKQVYSTKNLVILGIFMAGIMVINLPMFTLKFKSLALKENWYRYLFLTISVVLLLVFKAFGLAFVIFAYILLNIVFYIFKVKYE
jgi:CDP-diacylglycerol--serine O-phosphatidyltransferase